MFRFRTLPVFWAAALCACALLNPKTDDLPGQDASEGTGGPPASSGGGPTGATGGSSAGGSAGSGNGAAGSAAAGSGSGGEGGFDGVGDDAGVPPDAGADFADEPQVEAASEDGGGDGLP